MDQEVSGRIGSADPATQASPEAATASSPSGECPLRGGFTPGPWHVERETGDSNFWHSIYSEGFKGLLVGQCDQNGSHTADAHLIAAAPELYEQLLRVSGLYVKAAEILGLSFAEVADHLEASDAAIAKARGEQVQA